MIKVFLNLSLLVFAFAQLGCAQSKKSCINTNWGEQGRESGMKGEAVNDILETQRACAKKDVEFPIMEYKQGWLTGIEKYCSADNAYNLGIEGEKTKVENCPIEYQVAFNKSYKKGENYAETQKKIKELEKKKKQTAKQAKKTSKELSKEIQELKESK
jgi:hypothetical protein